MEILRKDPRFLTVSKICQKLWQAGYQALLAGGCVRDGLLGITPHDFDVATDATPDQVEALFPKTVAVGKSFGVMVVVDVDANGEQQEIEVATFRLDGSYRDGRRPDLVEYSIAEEDAHRRDFKINALFYDLENKNVVDYVDGMDDIGGRLITAVGDPDLRFREDHLRILRALRFVSQLDFSIEEKTLEAIKQLHSLVGSVSGERIHQEIIKLISGKANLKALRLVFDTQVLKSLLKDGGLKWVDPAAYFSTKSVTEDELWARWWLWVEALRGKRIDEKKWEELSYSFRMSRHQSQFVKKVLDVESAKGTLSGESVGSLLNKMRDPAFEFALRFFQARDYFIAIDKWQQILLKYESFRGQYPAALVQAADLPKELQGKDIGETLRLAYEAQLEGLVEDKESALKVANGSKK